MSEKDKNSRPSMEGSTIPTMTRRLAQDGASIPPMQVKPATPPTPPAASQKKTGS